jgi:hypothetical protein
MHKRYRLYDVAFAFLRKGKQYYGHFPGSISFSKMGLSPFEETSKPVHSYELKSLGCILQPTGCTAYNTGRAFVGAIGTMMQLICVYQTAIMQPIRIPIETVITGFGVLGLFLRVLVVRVVESGPCWGNLLTKQNLSFYS